MLVCASTKEFIMLSQKQFVSSVTQACVNVSGFVYAVVRKLSAFYQSKFTLIGKVPTFSDGKPSTKQKWFNGK